MRSFIEEIVNDIQKVIPKFDCQVDESSDQITLGYKGEYDQREFVGFSKVNGLEDTEIIKRVVEELVEFVFDSDPYGIVITPKDDREFEISDPFFDEEDEEDCSGGFHPSYSLKDCGKVLGKVAKVIGAIGGFMEIEKQNLKSGASIKVFNKHCDIRMSIRVANVGNQPILIVRIGDYKNYNLETYVIDGTSESGRFHFMAVEFINSLIPKMIELGQSLALMRYEIDQQSRKFVEQLFAEMGIKSSAKKQKSTNENN